MTAEKISQLEAAIASLETQRAILGDSVVDAALAPLRQQLAEFKNEAPKASAFEGERKQVTIMFADISGFTAMSEKMDPEQVRSLMNACFDHLVPAIKKYDGTVDKFIGDEIMALFGAPLAHENDPERALRAALEMQELLRGFNEKNETSLGLHFGINTGPVIAGGIGSQAQQQYSVIGDAVNLASRLEDASESGEIFAGPDTYRMTAPLFEFETLAPIRVKGKSEPVSVYKLLRVKAMPGRVRGLTGLTSAMVGRDAELNALINAIRKGGAVVVVGEAGLGKSRLIAEWKQASPLANVTFVEGRCLSYGQGLAYHLLIDLLYSLIGVPPAAEPAEMESALRKMIEALFAGSAMEVFPYLGHLLSLPLEGEAHERVLVLDPQALQAQYLNALRQLLKALADQRALVVILEDIHWADPSSIELLIKLLPLSARDQAEGQPILFCALSRPDQDTPGWRWVESARASLADRFNEIHLQPLTEADSRQLVSNLLEVEALPEVVRHTILQKSEGNPFFVEEVIRMLIDRGAIVRQGERWAALKEIENVEIPDSLQGLLMARIDRLPEDVKRTLRVASVIGRQFAVKVLEEVLRA
jgi:class 3 adenylate cyclase